jgi:hypothetical protein
VLDYNQVIYVPNNIPNAGGGAMNVGSKKGRQNKKIVLSANNVNYEKPPQPQARDSSFGPMIDHNFSVVDYHES